MLKISTENLTNTSCRRDQYCDPFRLPKIVPKSSQNHKKLSWRPKKVAVALPKPPRRLQNPPQGSRKAPEASANASKSFKNESKNPQDGKSHTSIHSSLQFAVNSNIPYAKIALPVCCPSFIIRTRLLTRHNSMFAAQR